MSAREGVKRQIICVTCGADRTTDPPWSSCEHERDYLDFAGHHHTEECGDTQVLCIPNDLSWAAGDLLDALDGILDEYWETLTADVQHARVDACHLAIAKAKGELGTKRPAATEGESPE